ncbi:MAG: hypothetical protein ABS77_00055 [Phenylobacterium sp. SCN 69-14]|nr:MAG: hypothetical protein ABS77_00055 [Phenylobacterium sp. SCN 69-14]
MDAPELAPFLAAEIEAEAARRRLAHSDFTRHQGVCWSGLAPEPPAPVSLAELHARARNRQLRQAQWRAGADGALLTAVAECQAAARQAYQISERIRAGLARGEGHAWRAQAIADLHRSARAALAGARRARRALES